MILRNVVRHHHPPKDLERFLDSEYVEAPTEWECDRLIASGVWDEGNECAQKNGIFNAKTMVEV
jgi:hypothetical protein